MKWRFFRSLHNGGTPDHEAAKALYIWHIVERSGQRMDAGLATDGWKLSVEDYVASASNLHASMCRHGFLDEFAVPVDPDGELLAGSHRVACALALGIDEIPVRQERNRVWAPAWGYPWFVGHKCPVGGLTRILFDYAEMRR